METFFKILMLVLLVLPGFGLTGCRFEKKGAMTPLENPKTEEMAPTQAMPAMPTPPEVTPPPAVPPAPATPETMVQPKAPLSNPEGPSAGTPEKESGY